MIDGCDRCDHGYVRVQQAYVERKAPFPAPLSPELMAEEGMAEAYELLVAQVVAKRAALANSYYPCRDCLPAAFYRWAGGHWEPNHDRTGCAECRELDGRRGAPRRSSSSRGERDLLRDGPAPVPAGPARRDLDDREEDERLWKG